MNTGRVSVALPFLRANMTDPVWRHIWKCIRGTIRMFSLDLWRNCTTQSPIHDSTSHFPQYSSKNVVDQHRHRNTTVECGSMVASSIYYHLTACKVQTEFVSLAIWQPMVCNYYSPTTHHLLAIWDWTGVSRQCQSFRWMLAGSRLVSSAWGWWPCIGDGGKKYATCALYSFYGQDY